METQSKRDKWLDGMSSFTPDSYLRKENDKREQVGKDAVRGKDVPSVEYKKRFIGVHIDRSKYVNVETGETLASEGGMMIRKSEEIGGVVEVSYPAYMVINIKRLPYLIRKLREVDLSRLFVMASMCTGKYNTICTANNRPISTSMLATLLGITVKTLKVTLDNLVAANVMGSEVIPGRKGSRRRVFYLNPEFARRGRYYSSELIDMFATEGGNMDGIADDEMEDYQDMFLDDEED